MNTYVLLKWMHVLSSTVLFGTGIGIAFFKWITDRSGSVAAIRVVAERVVLADLIFTTPAVIVQAATGIGLVHVIGFPFTLAWIEGAIVLYLVAGAAWLPVLVLQLRMRDLARAAERAGTALPAQYWRYARAWFWLGVVAFAALIVVFWLMVAKPA